MRFVLYTTVDSGTLHLNAERYLYSKTSLTESGMTQVETHFDIPNLEPIKRSFDSPEIAKIFLTNLGRAIESRSTVDMDALADNAANKDGRSGRVLSI